MKRRPREALTFSDWEGNLYRIPRAVLRRYRMRGLLAQPPPGQLPPVVRAHEGTDEESVGSRGRCKRA
jgi:hypothetical protein